jgi:Protein phosphatase 2C
VSRVVGNVFWFAKDERSPNDWEDGAALDLSTGRLAVADGASAAYRAREWATHLVESYIAAAPSPDSDPETAIRWFGQVAESWKSDDGESGGPEWYHLDAARRGSFATFVGAQLTASQGNFSWSALAVGDCCLLQIRGEQVLTAFPLADPADFTNAPVLVPSAADKLHLLRHRVHTTSGSTQPGDLILLSSDAFAKFMLTEAPRGGALWPVLRSIADNREFGELVRYLRKQRALEIDDVTLLRVIVNAG